MDEQNQFINVTVLARAVADQLKDSIVNRTGSRRVLNLAEAAEYCGLTRDSFKKKVVRDRLRKVRLDKCWRFDIADLDEWIDSTKIRSPRKPLHEQTSSKAHQGPGERFPRSSLALLANLLLERHEASSSIRPHG